MGTSSSASRGSTSAARASVILTISSSCSAAVYVLTLRFREAKGRGMAKAPMDASSAWFKDFSPGRYSSQAWSSAASSSPSWCSSRIASSALRVAEHRNLLPIFSSARSESRIRRFTA